MKNIQHSILFILGGVLLGIAFKITCTGTPVKAEYAETCVKETVECTPKPVQGEIRHNISHVTLTCYQPVTAQCNEDPLTTADGSKINLKKLKKGSIKWCAVSRDIEYLFPMGSKVKLTNESTGECLGYYEVHDRMNKRWNHRVDILIHPDDNDIFKYTNIKIEQAC